jgi:outer membrane protein OmpA-like peptidoglycan-associated protein
LYCYKPREHGSAVTYLYADFIDVYVDKDKKGQEIKMNKKIKTFTFVIACGLSVSALADSTGFESRWYAGIGAGKSRLEPDTNNTIYSVSDDSSSGWKIYAGYDWNEKWGIEAYFADLGESGLSPNGTVEYKDFGVSGLYYFHNNRGDSGRNQRTNLSIFGKAGLGFMKNDSDVPYDRLNDAHIMLGAGLEYGFANGIAVRAEAEFYDEDSQFYSISVLKRFGKKSKKAVPIAPVASAPMAAVVKDKDGDGIVDRDDRCPTTKAGTKVDSQGCPIADVIVLKGVLFETSSARLKDISMSILNQAAETLKRYPEMKVEVAGHTDSIGAADLNLKLSNARANAVRQYLVSKGVSADRMTARGYGETQPIEDNATHESRATNRRVELRILK